MSTSTPTDATFQMSAAVGQAAATVAMRAAAAVTEPGDMSCPMDVDKEVCDTELDLLSTVFDMGESVWFLIVPHVLAEIENHIRRGISANCMLHNYVWQKCMSDEGRTQCVADGAWFGLVSGLAFWNTTFRLIEKQWFRREQHKHKSAETYLNFMRLNPSTLMQFYMNDFRFFDGLLGLAFKYGGHKALTRLSGVKFNEHSLSDALLQQNKYSGELPCSVAAKSLSLMTPHYVCFGLYQDALKQKRQVPSDEHDKRGQEDQVARTNRMNAAAADADKKSLRVGNSCRRRSNGAEGCVVGFDFEDSSVAAQHKRQKVLAVVALVVFDNDARNGDQTPTRCTLEEIESIAIVRDDQKLVKRQTSTAHLKYAKTIRAHRNRVSHKKIRQGTTALTLYRRQVTVLESASQQSVISEGHDTLLHSILRPAHMREDRNIYYKPLSALQFVDDVIVRLPEEFYAKPGRPFDRLEWGAAEPLGKEPKLEHAILRHFVSTSVRTHVDEWVSHFEVVVENAEGGSDVVSNTLREVTQHWNALCANDPDKDDQRDLYKALFKALFIGEGVPLGFRIFDNEDGWLRNHDVTGEILFGLLYARDKFTPEELAPKLIEGILSQSSRSIQDWLLVNAFMPRDLDMYGAEFAKCFSSNDWLEVSIEHVMASSKPFTEVELCSNLLRSSTLCNTGYDILVSRWAFLTSDWYLENRDGLGIGSGLTLRRDGLGREDSSQVIQGPLWRAASVPCYESIRDCVICHPTGQSMHRPNASVVWVFDMRHDSCYVDGQAIDCEAMEAFDDAELLRRSYVAPAHYGCAATLADSRARGDCFFPSASVLVDGQKRCADAVSLAPAELQSIRSALASKVDIELLPRVCSATAPRHCFEKHLRDGGGTLVLDPKRLRMVLHDTVRNVDGRNPLSTFRNPMENMDEAPHLQRGVARSLYSLQDSRDDKAKLSSLLCDVRVERHLALCKDVNDIYKMAIEPYRKAVQSHLANALDEASKTAPASSVHVLQMDDKGPIISECVPPYMRRQLEFCVCDNMPDGLFAYVPNDALVHNEEFLTDYDFFTNAEAALAVPAKRVPITRGFRIVAVLSEGLVGQPARRKHNQMVLELRDPDNRCVVTLGNNVKNGDSYVQKEQFPPFRRHFRHFVIPRRRTLPSPCADGDAFRQYMADVLQEHAGPQHAPALKFGEARVNLRPAPVGLAEVAYKFLQSEYRKRCIADSLKVATYKRDGIFVNTSTKNGCHVALSNRNFPADPTPVETLQMLAVHNIRKMGDDKVMGDTFEGLKMLGVLHRTVPPPARAVYVHLRWQEAWGNELREERELDMLPYLTQADIGLKAWLESEVVLALVAMPVLPFTFSIRNDAPEPVSKATYVPDLTSYGHHISTPDERYERLAFELQTVDIDDEDIFQTVQTLLRDANVLHCHEFANVALINERRNDVHETSPLGRALERLGHVGRALWHVVYLLECALNQKDPHADTQAQDLPVDVLEMREARQRFAAAHDRMRTWFLAYHISMPWLGLTDAIADCRTDETLSKTCKAFVHEDFNSLAQRRHGHCKKVLFFYAKKFAESLATLSIGLTFDGKEPGTGRKMYPRVDMHVLIAQWIQSHKWDVQMRYDDLHSLTRKARCEAHRTLVLERLQRELKVRKDNNKEFGVDRRPGAEHKDARNIYDREFVLGRTTAELEKRIAELQKKKPSPGLWW